MEETRHWVETVVVGLNLCPFAARELRSGGLHIRVSAATTGEQLLMDLQEALHATEIDQSVETTLLVHPRVLQDFQDYNQFLDHADALLGEMGLEGVYQIASFHPAYQFADTAPGDARNYSNRSPYPMLHLLAEASVQRAIDTYPDCEGIPRRNQQVLEGLGTEALQALIKAG